MFSILFYRIFTSVSRVCHVSYISVDLAQLFLFKIQFMIEFISRVYWQPFMNIAMSIILQNQT